MNSKHLTKGQRMAAQLCRDLFGKKEEAQDLIEWALLAAFIAIVVVVILFVYRDPLLNFYEAVLDHLNFANDQLLPTP